jgi:hypothetical protein
MASGGTDACWRQWLAVGGRQVTAKLISIANHPDTRLIVWPGFNL